MKEVEPPPVVPRGDQDQQDREETAHDSEFGAGV